ncbi:MAG TPA: HD domain-containing protein [Kiritimatiellia bacterium]|nr:HD domain-containing protein [Kiritimatiellia bacterium]HPJ56460.1 HD domain-containing protein [Kiritimatiellia bacterium]HPR68350.1 HD domain-containing protein [Kiritimatiellia bacterium]HRX05507.1 HD domain-containing protein [Kiritimatiellia bacterium]
MKEPLEQAKAVDAAAGAAAEPLRRLVAAVDIGSSAIRLDIGEIDAQGGVRVLESLRHGVRLGKDVFVRGRIQQDTLRRCVAILKNYARLLAEYGVSRPDQIRAVATSFAREASNRDMFVDRVSTATGIHVRVLEEAEEARLTYLAVRDILEADGLLNARSVAVLEIGSGGTILLYLKNGKVTVAQSFHGGVLRTREMLEAGGGAGPRLKGLFKAYASELVEQILQAIPREKVAALVVMGAGARFAAEQAAGEEQGEDPRVTRAPAARLAELADQLAPMPPDALVRRYKMTFQDATAVAPGVMTIAQAARALKIRDVRIVQATLRDGLLRDMALREHRSEGFEEQVVYSAEMLAARYGADPAHYRNVEAASLALFDELQEEHQLHGHERLLLRCAAILHDIGAHVNARAHHKHSMYLIANSDLFGLTRHDMQLVATVARYHRKAVPGPSHPEFAALPLEDRMRVAKLAAILRVADSIERSPRDAPRRLLFRREADRFVILVRDMEDLTMERLVLRTKGNLFADVFGLVPDVRELRAEPPGAMA